MNFFTHLMLSRVLYHKLSRKFELDGPAFRFGNIKPDLSPDCIRNPHILENYLFMVQSDANRLIQKKKYTEDVSLEDFSEDLGVICHYICDFFCFCHLDPTIYHRLFRHFLYELRLHFHLCYLLAGSRLRLKTRRQQSINNVGSMILNLRKEYRTKKNTPGKDLDYAILASLRACEFIAANPAQASGSSAATGS